MELLFIKTGSLLEKFRVRIPPKIEISFCNIKGNKSYYAKDLSKRFHVNDNTRISSTDSQVRIG